MSLAKLRAKLLVALGREERSERREPRKREYRRTNPCWLCDGTARVVRQGQTRTRACPECRR